MRVIQMKYSLINKNTVLLLTSFFIILCATGICAVDNDLKGNYLGIHGNRPPDTPNINGPTIGKPGVQLEYTIVSIDPEGDDIVYCFDWGDDSGQICIGPYPSGEEVLISHTWVENGTFIITVKAADILGEESPLATLRVKISNSRFSANLRLILFDIFHFFKIFRFNFYL
jgi:hypothetical protein